MNRLIPFRKFTLVFPEVLTLAVFVMIAIGCFAETGRDTKKTVPKGFPPPEANISAPPASSPATKPTTSSIPTNQADKELYEEIVQALQARYAEPSLLTSKKLSKAAIEGVLRSLEGSVRLFDAGASSSFPSSKRPAVNSASLLDPFIGYLRLERIEDDVAKSLEDEIQKLLKEHHATGLILDLRFAYGTNYSILPALASLFLKQPVPLFSVQRGQDSQTFQAAPTYVSTDAPLVILVNHETREAPEILCAVLQEQGRALVIGNSGTAGQAYESSDVKLSNGQILRLATGKIVLARKGNFFLKGTSPDVTIAFDRKTEKEIYDKPFRPPEPRLEARFYSEAILTGREVAPPFTRDKPKKQQDEPPSNGDMVLLRAIDLLKSIQALGLSSLNNELRRHATMIPRS